MQTPIIANWDWIGLDLDRFGIDSDLVGIGLAWDWIGLGLDWLEFGLGWAWIELGLDLRRESSARKQGGEKHVRES